MPTIHFITPSDDHISIDAEVGASVMEIARAAGVEGIDGDCGGSCSCATCHVRVAPEWISKVGLPSEIEEGMLGFAENVTELSRLSCQISVTPELDGLEVTVVARA